MAEQQKIVDLPKETTETPAPVTTVGETAPVEAKPVEAAPVAATTTEDKVTEEAKPAEAVEETKAEEKKEEVTPIEEGHLGHKAQGLSFPKNLIASKEYFFFGTDAVEPKTLSSYQRSEKSAETAQSNIAWASHTGKGLLFVGDKKAPSSIINLSDAKEPEVDGSNKFTLTSKGNKHTFKAANTAERDNWVSQLKLKIAEAKELAASVTESETYKNTIESFKPAKKEEKPVVEEAAKTEETPAVADEPVKEETPVAAAATEESPKEAAKEEPKVEEPKRRSASRKRASFFGFGGKKDSAPKSPKEEVNKKLEETPATETVPATEAPVAPTEAPTVEAEAPKVDDVPATTEPAPVAGETAATEEVKTPEEKPTATKRNSFFGGVFGKKEKKVAEPKAAEPAEEVISPKTEETAPVTATDAPVIPPVEPTTPLEAGVTNPGNAPVETVDVSATTPTVTEPKKDVKEKRKSSLPFAFGKRDKSPAPAAEGEKTEKAAKSSPFSKFRATIKGKSATPKAEDKPAEEAAKEETAVPVEETKATEETPVEAVAAPTTEQTPVVAETENKPENVSTSTPAPVTAAA